MKRLFILNPAARTCPPDLEARIRERFPDAEVAKTSKAGDATEIAAMAVRSGFGYEDLLVACGGDGTLGEVVRGSEGKACLGIIPVGTVNQVSARLGIPSTVEGALGVVENGEVRQLVPGLCRFQGEERERVFFIGISAGPDADAVHNVRSLEKKAIGRFAYGLAFSRRLMKPVRPTIECSIEGGDKELVSQVIIMKDSVYGVAFTLRPETAPEQEVLGVARTSGGRLSILKMLGSALGFWPPTYDNCHAKTVTLSIPGGGRFQIDGDAVMSQAVEATLAPWKLHVIGAAS